MGRYFRATIGTLALILGVGCTTVTTERGALRAYVNGDCRAILGPRGDRFIDRLSDRNELQAILTGFCLELGGAIEQARKQYEVLYADATSSERKGLARLRLHQLRRLAELGLTREQYAEQLKKQAKADGIHQMVPTRRVNPQYPRRLSSQGINGWSKLAVELAGNGRIWEVQPIDSDPPFLFDLAAVTAVKQWRYPSSTGSDPRYLILRMNFKLE